MRARLSARRRGLRRRSAGALSPGRGSSGRGLSPCESNGACTSSKKRLLVVTAGDASGSHRTLGRSARARRPRGGILPSLRSTPALLIQHRLHPGDVLIGGVGVRGVALVLGGGDRFVGRRHLLLAVARADRALVDPRGDLAAHLLL